jgi:hypothetical protein
VPIIASTVLVGGHGALRLCPPYVIAMATIAVVARLDRAIQYAVAYRFNR